jgi:hypothetical protein
MPHMPWPSIVPLIEIVDEKDHMYPQQKGRTS